MAPKPTRARVRVRSERRRDRSSKKKRTKSDPVLKPVGPRQLLPPLAAFRSSPLLQQEKQ